MIDLRGRLLFSKPNRLLESKFHSSLAIYFENAKKPVFLRGRKTGSEMDFLPEKLLGKSELFSYLIKSCAAERIAALDRRLWHQGFVNVLFNQRTCTL